MRVSCLMVTQPGREHLAAEAIADFQAQTWPDPEDRELVIVTDGGSEHVLALLDARGADAVGTFRVSRLTPRPLGALRNAAIASARGEVLVQWDDDDRYAPNRLECQARPLIEDDNQIVSVLTSQLMALPSTSADHDFDLHVVDWCRKGQGAYASWIPGTIAFHRARVGPIRYPESGARAARGEDDVFLAAATIGREHQVRSIDDPLLYLRCYHGANTWSLKHYRANADRLSRPLSEWDISDAGLRAQLSRWYPTLAKLRLIGHGGESLSVTLDGDVP